MIYIANLYADDFKNLSNVKHYNNLKKYLDEKNEILVPICIKLEKEISHLTEEEKEMFLSEYNIEESAINKIIKTSFKLLNLSTYFTAGEVETKAWTFKNGQNACECAGIIHSDFEKKFVKAEIIKYDDYIKYNGEKGCRENGKINIEGKTYLMQDGDVCYFKIAK